MGRGLFFLCQMTKPTDILVLSKVAINKDNHLFDLKKRVTSQHHLGFVFLFFSLWSERLKSFNLKGQLWTNAPLLSPVVPTCSVNEYVCASGGCVSASLRCDGHDNCLDGSDEVSTMICCLFLYFVCSGVVCRSYIVKTFSSSYISTSCRLKHESFSVAMSL